MLLSYTITAVSIIVGRHYVCAFIIGYILNTGFNLCFDHVFGFHDYSMNQSKHDHFHKSKFNKDDPRFNMKKENPAIHAKNKKSSDSVKAIWFILQVHNFQWNFLEISNLVLIIGGKGFLLKRTAKFKSK